MSRARLDVAVAGGGVVGAACALALARAGLDVALVEARPAPRWLAERPDLRVFALAPDNAALLGALGVWPQVLAARAPPYRRMRVWDAGGGDELGFDAAALARDELEQMLSTCDDTLRGLRDRALLLFAFSSGGRRRSEVTSAEVEHLRRVAEGFLFRLHHSKTDQAGTQRGDQWKPVLGRAGDALKAASLDPYSFLRDGWLQKRENEVYDGNPPQRFDYRDPDSP